MTKNTHLALQYYLKNNININPIIKNIIVVFFLLYLIAVGNNSLNEIYDIIPTVKESITPINELLIYLYKKI